MPHIINIEGFIGLEVEIKDIREQLEKANGEDVVVNIASPGGMISEGLLIRNELKNYKGKVDTHLTGAVASMAAYIAMAGEHRTAENNAVFFIHNGQGFAFGDHHVMFKHGKHLNSLTNIIAKEMALKSETDLAEIRSAMDEKTFYYGDEIKEAGFVHEMVGDEEPEDRAEAVAFAELMIEECQTKINTPESVKKDMAALATMMADEPEPKKTFAKELNLIEENYETVAVFAKLKEDKDKAEIEKTIAETKLKQIQVNQFKQKTEGKTMDLAEMKEKHPELYKEIMALGQAEGTDQERARVKMLIEMRAKFPKEHSQKVIDTAIMEGHDLNQVTINLIAADQTAAEVQKAIDDKVKPPGNGAGDAPEMKDGKMTHPDHLDAVGKEIANLPGVM